MLFRSKNEKENVDDDEDPYTQTEPNFEGLCMADIIKANDQYCFRNETKFENFGVL